MYIVIALGHKAGGWGGGGGGGGRGGRGGKGREYVRVDGGCEQVTDLHCGNMLHRT